MKGLQLWFFFTKDSDLDFNFVINDTDSYSFQNELNPQHCTYFPEKCFPSTFYRSAGSSRGCSSHVWVRGRRRILFNGVGCSRRPCPWADWPCASRASWVRTTSSRFRRRGNPQGLWLWGAGEAQSDPLGSGMSRFSNFTNVHYFFYLF